MKKMIHILAIMATAQLLLILFAYMGGGTLHTASASAALIDFNNADVNRLMVADAKGAKIILQKQQQGWQTENGFPADATRIETLLTRLKGLKHGLAVATSASALPRFRVGEKSFERHVTLSKGDHMIAELYLGKGAGARQSYARSGNDHAVYRVTLGSYDLPLTEDAWQDKSLLQISSEAVVSITVQGVKLTKVATDGKASKEKSIQWISEQVPAGKQLDQKAVQQVLNLIASLRFNKAFKSLPAGFDIAAPAALELDVSSQNKHRHYRFIKSDKAETRLLKVSDRKEYFEISSYTFKAWYKQMKPEAWFVDLPAPGSADTKQGQHTVGKATGEE